MRALRVGILRPRPVQPEDWWPDEPVWRRLRASGLEVGPADALGGSPDVLVAPNALSGEPPPVREAPLVAVLGDARWGYRDASLPGLAAPPDDAGRKELHDRAERWVAAVDRLVMLSEATRGVVRTLWPDREETTDAIPPPPAPVAVPPSAAGAPRPPYLAVLADHRAAGNLPRTLQALAILRARGPERLPPVVLVGAGTEAVTAPGGMGETFGMGVPARLRGLGRLGRGDRLGILRRASAVVVPETYSGWGAHAREALAAGRPLAIADTAVNQEALRDEGLWTRLFDPYDVSAIADAVADVLAPGRRFAALAARAARRLGRRDVLPSADAWRDVLERAAGRRGAPAPRMPAGPGRSAGREGRARVAIWLPRTPSLGGIRFASQLLEGMLEAAGPDELAVRAEPGVARAALGTLAGELRVDPSAPARVIYAPWPHSEPPPATEEPLACTWHDFNYLRFGTLPDDVRALNERIAPAWFAACRTVIHSTRFILAEREALYGNAGDRGRVVPLAVAREFLAVPPDAGSEVAARYGLPERFLLVPQSYHEHKGQDGLLAALGLLREAGGDVHAVFTGARTERLDGRAPGVYGLGIVPDAELLGLYARCAGVVAPSRYEAGSFPLMEAMAVGRPAAVTRIPAVVEQAERCDATALWFDPDDVPGMARVVGELWDRGLPPGALEENRRRIAARGWRDVAEEYLDALDPPDPPAERGPADAVIPSRRCR
jgi:glycosyltransferase involved in cell wall biosynthesis